jgi:hypothetical protein
MDDFEQQQKKRAMAKNAPMMKNAMAKYSRKP